jgi:hypothetical protein
MNVDDCLLSQNVIFQLTEGVYNVIQFLVIGGVFMDSMWECLTMVCYQMTMLSDKCAYNIFKSISLNLEWFLQIR